MDSLTRCLYWAVLLVLLVLVFYRLSLAEHARFPPNVDPKEDKWNEILFG